MVLHPYFLREKSRSLYFCRSCLYTQISRGRRRSDSGLPFSLPSREKTSTTMTSTTTTPFPDQPRHKPLNDPGKTGQGTPRSKVKRYGEIQAKSTSPPSSSSINTIHSPQSSSFYKATGRRPDGKQKVEDSPKGQAGDAKQDPQTHEDLNKVIVEFYDEAEFKIVKNTPQEDEQAGKHSPGDPDLHQGGSPAQPRKQVDKKQAEKSQPQKQTERRKPFPSANEGRKVRSQGREVVRQRPDDPWEEVKKCRYIRVLGETPHERLPADTVRYVFGGDSSGNGDGEERNRET